MVDGMASRFVGILYAEDFDDEPELPDAPEPSLAADLPRAPAPPPAPPPSPQGDP